MSSLFFKGEISISNAFSVTKILFDPTIEHVDNFKIGIYIQLMIMHY